MRGGECGQKRGDRKFSRWRERMKIRGQWSRKKTGKGKSGLETGRGQRRRGEYWRQ
jgi:hypothetical protein